MKHSAQPGKLHLGSSSVPVRLYLLLLLLSFQAFPSCARGPSQEQAAESRDPNTRFFLGSGRGSTGAPLKLEARLGKPEGDGPFPALVLLHGCRGISPHRDHRWAERLAGWGYVTLLVDSLRPRGLSSVCTVSGKEAADILGKRVIDAHDARNYLAGLPFVDRSRIGIVGWSHGGATTLEALYLKRGDPFRAAIAFYPLCRRTLSGLNAPLLILIGESDDWTPAARCVAEMPKEKTAFDVVLKLYPGAHHGFDIPGANTNIRGSRGMHHLEYHPAADADAVIQVREFLQKHLK